MYGLAWQWRPGDRVLASVAEYGSNMIALLQLQRHKGVCVEVIPETPEGDVCLASLERLLVTGRRPVLLSLTHVPTSSGASCRPAASGKERPAGCVGQCAHVPSPGAGPQ